MLTYPLVVCANGDHHQRFWTMDDAMREKTEKHRKTETSGLVDNAWEVFFLFFYPRGHDDDECLP